MSIPSSLREFFEQHPKVALAFSGGVDSAYLLWVASQLNVDVLPIFIKSQFQPDFELADAKRLADEFSVKLQVIELDLSQHPTVLANRSDRCYDCKKLILNTIIQAANQQGYDCLIDGNNASDDASDRPGMRAVAELEVLSPLRLAGLGKAEIRRLSKEAGLFTWDKPAYSCLATRIATDQPIELSDLDRIEQAEAALSELGLRDFRVRLIGQSAKLEVTEEQLAWVVSQRAVILDKLRPTFDRVLLDLATRKSC